MPTTKKTPVKKAVAKKAPAKKAAAAKKPVAKKPAAKKAPAKKAVVKKAPAKKVVAKKAPVAKKPVAKKPAAKKAPAKKAKAGHPRSAASSRLAQAAAVSMRPESERLPTRQAIARQLAACRSYLVRHDLKATPESALIAFVLTWDDPLPELAQFLEVFQKEWGGHLNLEDLRHQWRWLGHVGEVIETLLNDPPASRNDAEPSNDELACRTCGKSTTLPRPLRGERTLLSEIERRLAGWQNLAIAYEVRGSCPHCRRG